MDIDTVGYSRDLKDAKGDLKEKGDSERAEDIW